MQAANCLLAGAWGADTVVRSLRVSGSCGGHDAPAELRHPMRGNDARLSSRLAPDPGRRNPDGARRHALSAPDLCHRARLHHRHGADLPLTRPG